MELLNAMVCAAYTDVVVKLSPTLVDVPGHNLVCNVHGVRGAPPSSRAGGGPCTHP